MKKPEQDPLMNYRIKKVTKPNGKVRFYPQKKIFGFLWWNLVDSEGYGFECWAHTSVFADCNKTLKDKVEYLAPDISKTITAEHNPPPKNP